MLKDFSILTGVLAFFAIFIVALPYSFYGLGVIIAIIFIEVWFESAKARVKNKEEEKLLEE